MNSQQLLYINFGIGLFFVLYFFFFRTKPKQPTRLNLRAKTSLNMTEAENNQEERAEKVARVLAERTEEPKVLPVANKSIKIFFIYNAHEWEAHEVLGIQQGATLQQATERYQLLIKTSDISTLEFFEAAFSAVLQNKGRS